MTIWNLETNADRDTINTAITDAGHSPNLQDISDSGRLGMEVRGPLELIDALRIELEECGYKTIVGKHR